MKTCKRCQRTLDLDQFYVHAQMADQRLNFCKDCVRERVRRHRCTPAGQVANRRAYERKKRNGHLRAQDAVKRALMRGELQREPCEVCGEVVVQAHHDDYAQPLAVRWLCSAHHGVEHRTLSIGI